MRVLVASEHPLIRIGLLSAIKGVPVAEAVGSVAGWDSLVATAERTSPDLILLDIERPAFGWLRAIDQVLQLVRHPAIVCISASGDRDFLAELSASGTLVKPIKGHSRSQVQLLLQEIVQSKTCPARTSTKLNERTPRDLTVRECEILTRVAHGCTSQEIAVELGVSVRTVDFHRANILRKTGARSPADAARYAVQSGVLTDVSSY